MKETKVGLKQTEIGLIPEEWEVVRLGEVCEMDSNQVLPNTADAKQLPYVGLEHIESGTGRIINAVNDLDDKPIQSTTFRFGSQHVLYGKLRPYLNKVAIPDFEGRCTTELLPLLPVDGCDRLYLAWLLRRAETVEEAMRHKTGTRMPRTDMDELFKMLVPLPPTEEQHRIATKLQGLMQEVERARTACEKQLEPAKGLSAACLREVFESDEAKKWERKKLGEIAKRYQYGLTAASSTDAVGYPLLRISDIDDNGNLKEQHLRFVECDDDTYEKYRLEEGDILIARSGSVGRSFLYEGKPQNAIFASYLIRFKPMKEIIDPKFLFYFTRSDEYLRFINWKKHTLSQPNINAQELKSLEVPLPPLPIQRHIAAELKEKMAEVEKLRTSIENQLESINTLPQTILRKAFKGEL
ncbi:restriction endonuclease subunit S [Dehalococcoidia bacterium]|nr:restriction endonuclease subunit S [Dehalococcoidia bacterium]